MKTAKCLECRVPFDRREHTPRILSQCGHSICEQCIHKSPIQNMKCFTCPHDKQARVLWTYIDELPINQAVYDILPEAQIVRKCTFGKINSQHSIVSCTKHDKPIEFTCCGQKMCSECLLFTKHKTHDFQRINAEPDFGQNSRMVSIDGLQLLSVNQSLHEMKEHLKSDVSGILKGCQKKLMKQQETTFEQIDRLVIRCKSQLNNAKSRQHTHSEYYSELTRVPSPSNQQNYDTSNNDFGQSRMLYNKSKYSLNRHAQQDRSKISSFTTRLNRSISTNNNSRNHKYAEQRYENKCRIENVIQIIRSQSLSPCLQLINLQIQDYFIPSIIDTIMESGRKIGVIKLGKNEITDEGLRMLLKAFLKYPYIYSLNLISNRLTEDCLDDIMKFRIRNKTLTNFYLAGNQIRGSHIRHKKHIMYENDINVFL